MRLTGTTRFLLALAPSWLALGWLVSKAQWFWTHRPDMQFGWIVLMLSAFLVWDKWPARPPAVLQPGWPLFVFATAGAALLFVVQVYQAAYGMMPAVLSALTVGIYALIFANIHYVSGWAGVRFFAFPLLFFLIALPLPSFIYDPIVSGLQQKVARINVEVLNVFGIPARQVGSLIQLPNGTVGVNEACSGIRSLQSTVMATLFIGCLTLKSRSLQAALLVIGITLAVFGNVLRSLYLSVTANARGLQAVEQVHDTAGWSILLFTACGVALIAWLLNKFEKWSAAESARLAAEHSGAAA